MVCKTGDAQTNVCLSPSHPLSPLESVVAPPRFSRALPRLDVRLPLPAPPPYRPCTRTLLHRHLHFCIYISHWRGPAGVCTYSLGQRQRSKCTPELPSLGP